MQESNDKAQDLVVVDIDPLFGFGPKVQIWMGEGEAPAMSYTLEQLKVLMLEVQPPLLPALDAFAKISEAARDKKAFLETGGTREIRPLFVPTPVARKALQGAKVLANIVRDGVLSVSDIAKATADLSDLSSLPPIEIEAMQESLRNSKRGLQALIGMIESAEKMIPAMVEAAKQVPEVVDPLGVGLNQSEFRRLAGTTAN